MTPSAKELIKQRKQLKALGFDNFGPGVYINRSLRLTKRHDSTTIDHAVNRVTTNTGRFLAPIYSEDHWFVWSEHMHALEPYTFIAGPFDNIVAAAVAAHFLIK